MNMGYLQKDSKPSYAWANFSLVAVIELCRIAFIARLPDGKLVQNMPDDAFYYLQAARNFVRLGRWTFDGVEPSSGFHLLWGYFLAGIFSLHPSSSIHFLFIIAGIVQSACLALAAYLLTKTTERFVGPAASAGILLVILSAASILQGTAMMESPLVIACGAGVLYLLARVDGRASGLMLAAVFSLGVASSLSRSDSGLFAFWMLIGHISLWRRGISNRQMVTIASVLLLGSIAGVVGVALNTHWISGQWAQASAQQKFFWSQVQGRATFPVRHVFLSLFNPFTNAYDPLTASPMLQSMTHWIARGIELFLFVLIVTGAIVETRSKRNLKAIAFLAASSLTIVSYVFFYRYDSGEMQPWYVANFEVPAAFIAGIGAAWAVKRYRVSMMIGVSAMCIVGVACSFRATAPWQEAMFRAGTYLRSHRNLRPIGAWNAGIIGYVADDGITNLDGLMNDAILPYAKDGDLVTYVAHRRIGYIVDFSNVWIPVMSARGGYADGVLQHCIDSAEDPFPDDPDNAFGSSKIEIYKIRSGCTEAASHSPAVRTYRGVTIARALPKSATGAGS